MADGLIRRSSDIIELLLDKRASTVQHIRISTSPDLSTWTNRVDIPSKESIVTGHGPNMSWRGKIYYEFNPSTFSLNYPFWIRFQDLTGGTPGTAGPSYICAPPSEGSDCLIHITGTAPNESSIDDSASIVLPGASDVVIDNTGANSLLVAFFEDGPETTVSSGGSLTVNARVQRLFVRGSGGTTTFDLRLTCQY